MVSEGGRVIKSYFCMRWTLNTVGLSRLKLKNVTIKLLKLTDVQVSVKLAEDSSGFKNIHKNKVFFCIGKKGRR